MMEETGSQSKKIGVKKYIVVIGLVTLFLFLAGLSFYFYTQYQKTQAALNNNPKSTAGVRDAALIESIGKLIQLPTDEQPTIATVSDITKLSGQPFFAHAQNGDKVLIYTNNKLAILYRPSTNKIIQVAPVNLGTNPTNAPAKTTPNETAGVSPVLSPTHTPTPTSSQIPIQ